MNVNPEPKIETPENVKKFSVKEFAVKGLGIAILGVIPALAGYGISNYFDKSKIEEQLRTLNLEEQEKYKNIADILATRVDLRDISYFFTLAEKTEKGDFLGETKPPEILGFENTGTITNEDVRKATSTNFFPKGWINGKISSISYSPQRINIKDDVRALASNKREGFSSTIEFFTLDIPVFGTTLERRRYAAISLFVNALTHEICHSNDWETISRYSFIDRIQLLFDIISRVESEDSNKGIFVESDFKETNKPYHLLKGYDSKEQKYTAYKEYFAEICAGYFSDPESFEKKHPKDYLIVDGWIRKVEPDFKPREAVGTAFSATTGEISPIWKKTFN